MNAYFIQCYWTTPSNKLKQSIVALVSKLNNTLYNGESIIDLQRSIQAEIDLLNKEYPRCQPLHTVVRRIATVSKNHVQLIVQVHSLESVIEINLHEVTCFFTELNQVPGINNQTA